ncbi:tyrosine-type recombinase/integrase [Sandarakinorhabdus sp.]|uniref:tyrosine-type recombinase/integrase n=1 Tax=Sandarakinorhabdus sp. TaxID=1916663 RepID=UPI00333FFDDB
MSSRPSSYSGRRTFATRLNAAGIGIRTIQTGLAHSSFQTTVFYCNMSSEQVMTAVNLA